MTTLNRTRFLFQLAAAVTAATLLAACGGSDGPAPSPAPAPSPSPSPSPSPAPAAGAASECFSEAQFTAGTTFQLNYSVSGAASGTSNNSGSVGSPTTFNGAAGVTPITATVSTNYSGISATTTVKNYQRIEGMDVLQYGLVTSTTAAGIAFDISVITNPASRDKRYTLSKGGTYTLNANLTTTTTPPGTSTTSSTTTLVTYLGQESVTVPAGTYTACKFTDVSGGLTSTTWIAKGKGVLVKSLSPSGTGGTLTMELQGSSRLNGAPI